MNQPSPYQPPLPQTGPPALPQPWIGDPSVVKVLGILHLIFAGLGLLQAAFGAVTVIFGNPLLKLMPKTPAMEAQMAMQTAMQTKMMPVTIAGTVISLLIAVPMVIAGIKMLKKRRSGLKWSNLYAWTSIGGKVINMILVVSVMLPAMRAMMHGISRSGPPLPAQMETIMSVSTTVGAIIGVVFTCIYPVLTLILLNRAPIKDWFARQAV
jgi:hypothetical protein